MQALKERFDAAAHLKRGDAVLLHPEGNLIFHGIGHRLGLWFLKHHARDSRHLAGRGTRGIHLPDAHLARDLAAVELRDQAVEQPKEAGFTTRGRPGEQEKCVLRDIQRDVPQGRRIRAGVPIANPK